MNLNANVKLALQQAADDTVFNQTTGMSYYPWEVSGTAAFGLGSSIPKAGTSNGRMTNWPTFLPVVQPQRPFPSRFHPMLLPISTATASPLGPPTATSPHQPSSSWRVEAEPSASAAFLRQSDVFLPRCQYHPGCRYQHRKPPLNIDWTSRSTSAGTGAPPCLTRKRCPYNPMRSVEVE